MTERWPSEVRITEGGRVLAIAFEDGGGHRLDAEYLRVMSPSAEVRGHGAADRRTESGKRAVRIVRAEPVGNYAVRLVFDDGHQTGLYKWDYLDALGREHAARWAGYLAELAEKGLLRG